MQKDSLENARNHAWNYFALHAQQRISVFQYFISIETALITAAFLTLQYKEELENPLWPIVLGPAIIIFSFVFWKIDQRTRDLIVRAETSLKQIENEICKDLPSNVCLPFSEDPQTKSDSNFSTFPLFPGRLTYSQAFGTIYVISAFFGCLFFALTIKSI